jgi:competence protein ComFC
MLHSLKYEGSRYLARPLGTWLGMLLIREAGWPLEAVIPLPLHRRREAQRGYNQSALIARYTAREMGLPVLQLLQKTRATPAQAGLSRIERQANVAGVFALTGRLPYPGAVLLIDDIYSTGATLKEAARLLDYQGCAVFAAVIAYNPRLS